MTSQYWTSNRCIWVLGIWLGVGTTLLGASPESEGWTDPNTGREYQIYSGTRSLPDSHRLCQQQDMALFTPEELSPQELQDLAASLQRMDNLAWVDSPTKTRSRTSLWTSRRVEGLVKKYHPRSKRKVVLAGRLWTLSRVRGKNLPPYFGSVMSSQHQHTVCMAIENHWFGCRGGMTCLNPSPAERYDGYTLIEFAAQKQRAIDRIVQRAQGPLFLGKNCVLSSETVRCQRYSF